MRIAKIINESVVDGPGIRVVLFVQGCNHRCPGCHNIGTWDINGGIEASIDMVLDALKEYLTPLHQGVTFSGGEPFLQAGELYLIGKEIKEMGYDLVVYTGFTMDYLKSESDRSAGVRQLMSVADYIIDGPFKKELADLACKWRGSSNQQIWYKKDDGWVLYE